MSSLWQVLLVGASPSCICMSMPFQVDGALLLAHQLRAYTCPVDGNRPCRLLVLMPNLPPRAGTVRSEDLRERCLHSFFSFSVCVCACVVKAILTLSFRHSLLWLGILLSETFLSCTHPSGSPGQVGMMLSVWMSLLATLLAAGFAVAGVQLRCEPFLYSLCGGFCASPLV